MSPPISDSCWFHRSAVPNGKCSSGPAPLAVLRGHPTASGSLSVLPRSGRSQTRALRSCPHRPGSGSSGPPSTRALPGAWNPLFPLTAGGLRTSSSAMTSRPTSTLRRSVRAAGREGRPCSSRTPASRPGILYGRPTANICCWFTGLRRAMARSFGCASVGAEPFERIPGLERPTALRPRARRQAAGHLTGWHRRGYLEGGSREPGRERIARAVHPP